MAPFVLARYALFLGIVGLLVRPLGTDLARVFAGLFAGRARRAPTVGTLPTPTFLVGVPLLETVLVGAAVLPPPLALGPFAEHQTLGGQ